MLALHVVILALIQGLTEFLPVSSSGHLALAHAALGEDIAALCWSRNRSLDVAVHVGTLFAVLLYFRQDLREMAKAFWDAARKGQSPAVSSRSCANANNEAGENRPFHLRLPLYLVTASLPVIAAGLALHLFRPDWLCLLEITAWTTLLFGVVLWLADRFAPAARELSHMRMKDSLLIGLAQALALVPGTSRSGITMSAARILGFSRTEAARFSLLLSIIAITGAGTLGILDLWRNGDTILGLHWLIAVLLSFLAGWGAIALMMRWLEKITFTPFAIYRICLGLGLLAFLYGVI